MNCREFEITMFDYRDNKLDSATMASCSSHLQSCATCRNQYQMFASAMEFIDCEKQLTLADGFELQVLQKVLQPKPQSRIISLPIRIMQYAAIIALFITTTLIGWIAGNRFYDSPVASQNYAQENILSQELYFSSSAQLDVDELLWNNAN